MSQNVMFKGMFSATAQMNRVKVTFKDMVPEVYGMRVQRGPIDISAIVQIGFIVVKPEIGKFELEIKEIGV